MIQVQVIIQKIWASASNMGPGGLHSRVLCLVIKILNYKRFRIISESCIVFLISVLSLILFFMIPDRLLLSQITKAAIFSVTKFQTHGGPLPLVVHLILFETIWITIMDLEPNPDFEIFLNISTTNHLIFISNISNCRSVQVPPFILFDLRALVNL